MSRWPQFRIGCVFWLTAAVAFLLWALRRNDHSRLSFALFVAGSIVLIVWGALRISETDIQGHNVCLREKNWPFP